MLYISRRLKDIILLRKSFLNFNIKTNLMNKSHGNNYKAKLETSSILTIQQLIRYLLKR
jgi:hypothetical protein